MHIAEIHQRSKTSLNHRITGNNFKTSENPQRRRDITATIAASPRGDPTNHSSLETFLSLSLSPSVIFPHSREKNINFCHGRSSRLHSNGVSAAAYPLHTAATAVVFHPLSVYILANSIRLSLIIAATRPRVFLRLFPPPSPRIFTSAARWFFFLSPAVV